MITRAAVMTKIGAPLSVREIVLDDPGPDEVLIRMVATGVCGSDAHILHGHFPAPTPSVCGHEGAGIVEAIGPAVRGIRPGDAVLHLFTGSCGVCARCRNGQRTFCTTRFRSDGSYDDGRFRMHELDGSDLATPLGLGSFSAHTVTPARNCIVIPPGTDLVTGALVACGVLTGIGAVLNIAQVRPGHNVAVIGAGGVGAAAIVGAVIGGAALIIALDIAESKRAPALAFGANDFVNVTREDAGRRLQELTDGAGVDRVILAADRVQAEQYQLAVRALAPGGVVVQVGSAELGADQLPIDPRLLTRKQASFTGTVYGSMNPQQDALTYLRLARAGRIPLAEFVTRTYGLDEINDAFADLAAGRNVRGVIVF